MLQVISSCFKEIIGTTHPTVGKAMTMIKEGYEDLLNNVVENLAC
jgi:hypothetical protein